MYRAVIVLNSLIWLVLGVLALAAPAWLMAPVGVSVDPSGIVELRAMYGGMELGMATLLLGCAYTNEQRTGLLVATFPLGGLGIGRLFGLLLTPDVVGLHYTLVAIEIVGTCINGAVLGHYLRGQRHSQ